jgi:hypothetical protein
MKMNASKSIILCAIAAIGFAGASGNAIAASAAAKAKRIAPSSQYQMSVAKTQILKKLKSAGGASKARECTWTNENIAECSEEIGDTIVFTCFDEYGKSIGC